MAEHRVSVLSASLRRYEDPERSADPRIRRIVADLRTLEPAPAPRAHFRAELRAQLVAVAPRLIAEGTHVEGPQGADDGRPATEASRTLGDRLAAVSARLGTLSLGRPLAVVTALVAVFALLLGGAVWVSKKALPGDALYALKRANENVQLSLTTGGAARGKEYLSLAGTRVDEAAELLQRSSAMAAGSGASAAGGVSGHTQKLVASTLGSADDDVRSAAQLLGGDAVRNGSTAPLTTMIDWAPGQLKKLQEITDRIPAGALHDRAAESTQLVRAAATRANGLKALSGCSCLGSAATDELGPIPCPVCDLPQTPGQPPAPASTAPSSGKRGGNAKTSKSPTGASATPGATSGGGSTAPAGAGSGSGTTSGGIATDPLGSITIQVPTLLPGSSSTSGGATATQSCVLSLLGICIKL